MEQILPVLLPNEAYLLRHPTCQIAVAALLFDLFIYSLKFSREEQCCRFTEFSYYFDILQNLTPIANYGGLN